MKLFIFGSTGDLIKRKVLPAIQNLDNGHIEIYALGRKEFTHEIYRDFVCGGKCEQSFKDRIHYHKIDYSSNDFCDSCIPQLEKDKTNYFYLALPPKLYKQVLNSLTRIKEKGYDLKILIEKPFGNSLEEARELQKTIFDNKLDEDVFLSDHYLFKENVLKLGKKDYSSLRIVSLEEVGLEGRINFYNETGAIRDMIQGHLINILFKIEKEKVLPGDIEIKKVSVGQYGNGIDEGYVKELGKYSETETFACVLMEVKGKKVEFITGKAFNEKIGEIIIDGKRVPFGEKNSYFRLFEDFFENKKDNFPSTRDSILSWEITSKILENKEGLFYYNQGEDTKKVLNFGQVRGE